MSVEAQLDDVRARFRLRGPRLAYRRLYRQLPRVLDDAETVVAFGDGYVLRPGRRARGAYVVLTDRRVLALGREVEEIPAAAVRAVEATAGGSGVLGFTGAGFRLETDAGEQVVRVRPRAVAEAMADALRPAAGADPVDAIRRLGELRDAGLVSTEEFETKKAELLGRI